MWKLRPWLGRICNTKLDIHCWSFDLRGKCPFSSRQSLQCVIANVWPHHLLGHFDFRDQNGAHLEMGNKWYLVWKASLAA